MVTYGYIAVASLRQLGSRLGCFSYSSCLGKSCSSETRNNSKCCRRIMMMKFLPGEATVNNKGVKTVCRPGLDPPGELTALPRPPIAGATAPSPRTPPRSRRTAESGGGILRLGRKKILAIRPWISEWDGSKFTKTQLPCGHRPSRRRCQLLNQNLRKI